MFSNPGWVCSLVLLLLIGCGPSPQGGLPPSSGTGAGPAAAAQPKTLVVAAMNPIKAFGDWSDSQSGGSLTLAEIHSNALVTTDAAGALAARVAARLPSFDDGTISILPDGRMQTTWKLRPDVKWHDGTPFTADDVVFTWQVNADPAIPMARTPPVTEIERVEAPDPTTAVITYQSVFFQPLLLGVSYLWLLPKHLLAEAFRGDKRAFVNLPYWTTEYVHLGPFRLVDFGLGESLVFERVDDYFLGQPKIDRLMIRVITDENTLLANARAGAIDIVTESTLREDIVAEMRQEWERNGGSVGQRQGNWQFLAVQFNPEWGRPPELGLDVRVRRGLMYALDRQGIRELAVPGYADTEADTFMVNADLRAPIVGKPFAIYPYDPGRATQQLAEAGWRRRGDGVLLNQAGEAVQISVRASGGNGKPAAAVAQQWRQLGVDAVEEVIPGPLASDNEYRAKYSGVELTARGSGHGILVRFDSRLVSTPQNRYSGANQGYYVNASLDRLIDHLRGTVDEREQALILKDVGVILAADLPALPLFFNVKLALVAKGIRALGDDFAGTGPPGFMSRNSHLWDRN